jgi:hypothetical protein
LAFDFCLILRQIIWDLYRMSGALKGRPINDNKFDDGL